jgi:catechol 2,3-dioxygenase-like lactoylglutathione lyase family enzyme
MRAIALKRVARNVTDLASAEKFYTEALGFKPVGAIGQDPELATLLQIRQIRILRLRSGDREIELSQCFPAGALYPRADANFVHFQHIALLSPDIQAAYTKALAAGAAPISTNGPVRLPPASGGVTAVKFRDPDGHPLEFIQNPAQGYDHSAISVLDAARSANFYAGIGVILESSQRNHGPEQDALDGLTNADLAVVALRPSQPSPHVELLCYHNPKAVPVHWAVTDICADRLVFAADANGLRLLRDPDGHVVLLDGR